MSKIDEITMRRVLDHVDIVDVVSDFVDLQKKGPRYFGLCPFHDDRHATNFCVYPAKQCYTCFACGAKGDAVGFLMEHERMSFPDAIRWLGKKYGIPVDDVPMNYTPPPPRPKPAPLPVLDIPFALVLRTGNIAENTLVKWIHEQNWDRCQMERIDKALNEYYIGHSRFGHTIFWQIDDKQRVRTGKMMLYESNGHRAKQAPYNFDYIHSALFRDKNLPKYDSEKVEVRQCLFGLHLLNAWPNAAINIVESEKTALLMAIAYGNNASQIWMACGGMHNISREKLAPLIEQKRKIQLFPDRDAIAQWKKAAVDIVYDRMTINTDLIRHSWMPCDGEKADVADIVMRLLNNR